MPNIEALLANGKDPEVKVSRFVKDALVVQHVC
jgi:hypothetical protein